MPNRPRRRMIESMAQLHMTEAELARDLHAVLERVCQGAEVVVEEGHRRVALIKPVEGPGRPTVKALQVGSRRLTARRRESPTANSPVPERLRSPRRLRAQSIRGGWEFSQRGATGEAAWNRSTR